MPDPITTSQSVPDPATMNAVRNFGTIAAHDLPDDILQNILHRLLPAPGYVTSTNAICNRRAFLKQFYTGASDSYQIQCSGADDDAVTAWHACLRCLDAPSALLEHPPWQPGAAADCLHNAAAASAMHVCKRWRALLQIGAKVSMCALEERPPQHTECLVVTLGWQRRQAGEGAAGPDLSYLQDLPHLRALIFMGAPKDDVVFGTAHHKGSETSKYVKLPAVPAGLEKLEHLAYIHVRPVRDFLFSAQHCKVVMPAAVLQSIAALRRLQTVSVPRCAFVKGDQAPSALLYSLRQLTALHARLLNFSKKLCVTLTALSSLAISCCDDEDVSALSKLPHLRSLRLCRSAAQDNIGALSQGDPDVQGISALTQIVHLELHGFGVGDSVKGFAGHPALESLKVVSGSKDNVRWSRHDSALVKVLAALPRTPALALSVTLRSKRAERCLPKLTALEELDLCMYGYAHHAATDSSLCAFEIPSAVNIGSFSALTRLTSLSLHGCEFMDGPASCFAIGCMTRLRKLHLESCKFTAPKALWTLTALEELCLHGHCCDAKFRDLDAADKWLKGFGLPSKWPGLKVLALQSLPKISAQRLDEMSKMSQLEVLDLNESSVEGEGLAKLHAMPELRALHVWACKGITAASLLDLAASTSLQFLQAHLLSSKINAHAEGVVALVAKGVRVML